MKCKNCGSTHIRAYVKVSMYIDTNDMYRFTKKVISKKTTELWAVDWDKTSFVCSECGYTWGYGYNNKS